MTPLVAAGVRVPCSTSNLGSGFDTLGIALDLYLEADFEPGGSELEAVRSGTLAALDAEGEAGDHLAWAFVRTLAAEGAAPRGVLSTSSEIPVARGLGSSAAALVAGHDLARAALGLPSDPRASFRFASDREGHGDNAAPCALGGLRAVVPTPTGPRALALELSPSVGFAYAAPGHRLATAEARAALPRQVPHATAVAQLGHLAALIRGLAVGDPDLLRTGVTDGLHVPHRAPLIPGALGAMEAALGAGAWAVTISGSGSGLIAMGPLDRVEAVAEAMHEAFEARASAGPGVRFVLAPDFEGISRDR